MGDMPLGDPYIEAILHNVPEKVARELSPQQWEGFREALRRARDNPRHTLDLRFILPLYFTRIYCILILGRDTRERVLHILVERRRRVFSTVGAVVLAGCFLGMLVVTLGVLYVIKTVAGIDLFPSFSFLHWWQ